MFISSSNSVYWALACGSFILAGWYFAEKALTKRITGNYPLEINAIRKRNIFIQVNCLAPVSLHQDYEI